MNAALFTALLFVSRTFTSIGYFTPQIGNSGYQIGGRYESSLNAGLDTTFIQYHVAVHLQHHDKASLLAGKLHAILQGICQGARLV